MIRRPSTRVTAVGAGDGQRRGADGVKEDLARQLTLMANRAASSRKVAQHILHLLDDPTFGPALLGAMQRAWRSREFRAYYERPLLLLASLRSDALGDGPAHPLHGGLRDEAPEVEGVTEAAVRSALDPSRTGLWTTLALRRVQTNDTSRALAWMWPAEIAGCSDGRRPILLVDVGCSAGLNLVGDGLPPMWTTTGGGALGVVRKPKVVERFGLDERPLDVARPDDARWLHACVWPGETARICRLDAAIARFLEGRARSERLEVVRRDAVGAPAFVRGVMAAAGPGTLTIVYQSMMSGYLDAASRAAFEDGLHQLVASSPAGSVLWADLEVTGPATSPRPAELWVHTRAGDAPADLLLGTMGYHPTEVSVRDDAVRDLTALLRD